jgi:YihY family inner membrane protein
MSRSDQGDEFFLPSVDERSQKRPPISALKERRPSYVVTLWNSLIRDHKASRLAAALTFRTIFSLVPVVIVCMVIVRGVVNLEEAEDWMRRAVYESPAWTKMFSRYSGPDVAEGINHIIAQTWQLDLADVGLAGGLLLIWAAVGLFRELETSFNEIMGITRRRPLLRRWTMYWAFVTLGPLLLFGALYGAAKTVMFLYVHPALPFAADFVAAWVMLLAIYKMLPNTEVRWSAVLLGSFVASVLWVIAKWGFEVYVIMAMPYAELYGSLALVPLFLFWLYMVCWIVLVGLEVVAFRQRRLEALEPPMPPGE